MIKIGNTQYCRLLLEYAFFGYAIQHDKDMLLKVLKDAKEIFNITFETYGVEHLDLLPPPMESNKIGRWVSCNYIGEFIWKVRDGGRISRAELSRGICSGNNLAKIENGSVVGNVYYMEVLMQRLGRHINHYFTTFPRLKDFNEKQIRDEVNTLLVIKHFDKAKELLQQLKDSGFCKRSINKQFILHAEATMIEKKRGENKLKYLNALYEALSITLPDFDEKNIANYRLSYYEIVIINQLANYYVESGDPKEQNRGRKIYKCLLETMDKHIVDEDEKKRMYSAVLYNYSRALGSKKSTKTAMKLVYKGKKFCLKHKRFIMMTRFILNQACNMQDLGQKQESVPFHAMAFYGSAMFAKYGLAEDADIIRNHVKEHFGIEFDHPLGYSSLSTGVPMLIGDMSSWEDSEIYSFLQ